MKTSVSSMPRLSAFITCISFLLCNYVLAQKNTIAVVDMDARGISVLEAQTLTDRLRNEMFRLGTLRVLDRGLMEDILAEQDLQMTGCTSDECLVQVGRLLGAQQIVGASISRFGEIFTVSARLIDVETGELIKVADYDLRGAFEDLLIKGMQQVAVRLGSDEIARPASLQASTDEVISLESSTSNIQKTPTGPSRDVLSVDDLVGKWNLSLLFPLEARLWATIRIEKTEEGLAAEVVMNLYKTVFKPPAWSQIRIVDVSLSDYKLILRTEYLGSTGGSTISLAFDKNKELLFGSDKQSLPPNATRQVSGNRVR
ncbi:CsgG/HfaB family protein [Candidatus Neomarinimicrobiota bacterium]